MIDQLPPLVALIKQLQQLPYLASKNVYRVAHHFLEMDDARMDHFMATLRAAHAALEKCSTCWAWKDRTTACLLCASPKRNHAMLCVVHTWHDLCALERTGGYEGGYHVLGGTLSPLDGVGPEDLTFASLRERIAQGGVTEVILALSQTPEGEATAAYIQRELRGLPVTISHLARGLPVGSSLEYMDRLTLHKALAERRPVV